MIMINIEVSTFGVIHNYIHQKLLTIFKHSGTVHNGQSKETDNNMTSFYCEFKKKQTLKSQNDVILSLSLRLTLFERNTDSESQKMSGQNACNRDQINLNSGLEFR